MIVVHQAAEAREDGSQRCIRCGLDLTPANGGSNWTPGDYIAVDEQETGQVKMKALGPRGDDSAELCMGATSSDAPVTPPQMLGETDE